MRKLKVEIIHDFACSWCAIGYKHLTDAANDLGIELDIGFIPHELNPEMGTEGMEIDRYFHVKHGWSQQEHDEYRASLIATVKAVGANIDFEYRTHYFNTNLAHRLLARAGEIGVAVELYEKILTAYHSFGENISDPLVLSELAKAVGMTDMAILSVLDVSKTNTAYERLLNRKKKFRVRSVPTWVIDDENLVTGSNSREFFKDCLSEYSQSIEYEEKICHM
ncbi:DsbA family protein [Lacimicrobium sp. SS2-24]|uniref:DsbA family oxidoreductase n=1 Tax=Lacimicrobium sp. SS2-24 TaxID=2005569 RepID=UPI000B4B011B|nr:DsbA family protein [Lacimicrobium sp. SS2-24]